MTIFPPFPDHRFRDPRRMAELAVYRELEASDAPGTAIYEAKGNRQCPEVDYAIWAEGVARYAAQLKGGIQRVQGGTWYRSTPRGEVRVPSPLPKIWDSTMKLHDYVQARVGDGRNPFFVPVLLLPDMEVDPAIEEWAEHTHVHVLFGTDDLVERLINLAPHAQVLYPPTAEEIAEEVDLVLPGRQPEPPQPPPDPQGIQARQVAVHHADQVIIYTTGGEATEETAMGMPSQPEPPAAPESRGIQAGHVVVHHADRVIIYTTGGEDGV